MKKDYSLSSSSLHILAMAFMLCDHLWHSLFPAQRWLTGIGRVAFPIFAFMLVEGFFHTHNRKKYMLRMLIFAIISELPFDMFIEGMIFYPYHQNVMWTFLIAMVLMLALEKLRTKRLWISLPLSILVVIGGFILGTAAFVDFFGFGVLMVLTFYFFYADREPSELHLPKILEPLSPAIEFLNNHRRWWCYPCQFICMYYINVELFGGMCYQVNLFGHSVEIVEQGLALFALLPIWLYRGRKGYNKPWFKYFCYAFYPVHFIVLYIIGMLTVM